METIRQIFFAILTGESTVGGPKCSEAPIGGSDLGLQYHWNMMRSWTPGDLQGLRGHGTVDLGLES